MPKSTMEISLSLPGLATCGACGSELVCPEGFAYQYFVGGRASCPHCDAEVDWWPIAKRIIEFDFPLLGGQALTFVGARGTIIKIQLSPHEVQHIKFQDHGVPADARIVYVNYTPVGSAVFPTELHGNEPRRHFFPREVSLYGRPLPKRPLPNEREDAGNINITVSWIPNVPDFTPWSSLVDAVEAYSRKQYVDLLIPANVAVEALLARLMAEFFGMAVSHKRVDEFLRSGATYSYQLNVVLPALAHRLGIPLLPDQIRGALKRLNNLRNDLAHRGELTKELDRSAAAESLCAALFAFSYIQLVRPKLLGSVSS